MCLMALYFLIWEIKGLFLYFSFQYVSDVLHFGNDRQEINTVHKILWVLAGVKLETINTSNKIIQLPNILDPIIRAVGVGAQSARIMFTACIDPFGVKVACRYFLTFPKCE